MLWLESPSNPLLNIVDIEINSIKYPVKIYINLTQGIIGIGDKNSEIGKFEFYNLNSGNDWVNGKTPKCWIDEYWFIISDLSNKFKADCKIVINNKNIINYITSPDSKLRLAAKKIIKK